MYSFITKILVVGLFRIKTKKLVLVLGLACSCLACTDNSDLLGLYKLPLSRSIIHINISGSITDTLYADAQALTNIPRGDSRSATVVITEPGDYFLDIEIDRVTSCILNFNDGYKIIVFLMLCWIT